MIYIRDDIEPESMAMLQALYSRSPASVLLHLQKVEATGPEKFMAQYYVGYGHKSIGDCGSTTLFIEGVSMLAAKAIQDWPLYSGQEASTRYMDFTDAVIGDPVGGAPEFSRGAHSVTRATSKLIQESWMAFYQKAQQPMLDHLHAKYPRQDGEKEDVYERAISARKFDVLRAFLPAGATTNLSWHTNLRQADDHLSQLVWHPDPTIRGIARDIRLHLVEKYPSSFKVRTGAPSALSEVEQWDRLVATDFTYDRRARHQHAEPQMHHTIDRVALDARFSRLRIRPKYGVFPKGVNALGQITSRFYLDFGSYRDLQRHRNGVIEMPLLTNGLGFEPWYFRQMPEALAAEARQLIADQDARIIALRIDGVEPEELQYYCAMGYLVRCEVTQTMPAFVYRIEQRTSPSVHPTLRLVAQREALMFTAEFPWVPLHADMTPDTWSTRRGTQTIVERPVGQD